MGHPAKGVPRAILTVSAVITRCRSTIGANEQSTSVNRAVGYTNIVVATLNLALFCANIPLFPRASVLAPKTSALLSLLFVFAMLTLLVAGLRLRAGRDHALAMSGAVFVA